MVSLVRKGPFQIQDYTTIGTVGSSGQQMAGHEFEHISSSGFNEPGTSWSEVLAYYKFGSAGGAITLDNQGAYTLTNVGSTSQAAGIFGGSTGAASFNGSTQWFTAGSLLGTTPTAIAIDCWFMLNDGQPASTNCLFAKRNSAGVDQLFAIVDPTATGKIMFTATRSSTAKNIYSTTILPDGVTGWYHLTVTWDVTNGIRMWVNGVLEAQDSSATTLMASGSGDNFAIGSLTTAGTWFWNGKIAYLRVRNKILSQVDVDVAYATKYSWIAAEDLLKTEIIPYVQEGGSSELVSQLSWGGMEAARKTNRIYRYGGLFSATDKLALYGKE